MYFKKPKQDFWFLLLHRVLTPQGQPRAALKRIGSRGTWLGWISILLFTDSDHGLETLPSWILVSSCEKGYAIMVRPKKRSGRCLAHKKQTIRADCGCPSLEACSMTWALRAVRAQESPQQGGGKGGRAVQEVLWSYLPCVYHLSTEGLAKNTWLRRHYLYLSGNQE